MAVLAILADIHANLEALEAVLADARACGATRFAALGDIIGFGGAPVACAERVRDLGAIALRGNHEAALLSPSLFAPFPAVQRMTERTRALLPPDLFKWLTTLPLTAGAEGMPLVHASFAEPARWGRLRRAEDAAANFAATSPAPLAFFGHTHRPTLFRQSAEGVVTLEPVTYDAGGSLTLRPAAGERYLVNPGSVGQPRDNDPRAAYALVDTATHALTLRRVPYDTARAAAATLAMGLPERFAAALQQGVSPL